MLDPLHQVNPSGCTGHSVFFLKLWTWRNFFCATRKSALIFTVSTLSYCTGIRPERHYGFDSMTIWKKLLQAQ